MNEPPLRYRKTPKSPFIAGNLLLASLGVGLVFFGPEPFSVATVLLVALCLATGGILTLLPFLLDQFALRSVQQARFSQAALNLRAVMERSEEILDRLDATDAENNPLRLVSERLPALVEEKIREAFERGLSEANQQRADILSAVNELQRLPDDVEKLHDDLRILSSHGATREFLATGLENLESKIHGLEVLLNETRRGQALGSSETKPPPQTDLEQTESPASETAPPLEEPIEEKARTEPVPQASESTPQPAPNRSEKEPIDKPAQPPPPSSPKRKRKTEVVVSAFVGIQNGIFLRGNGPGLDPGKGIRMEMTGIGEWGWSSDEVHEPFTAELFLNDQDPSSLGSFSVSPGDVVKLNPSFENNKERS